MLACAPVAARAAGGDSGQAFDLRADDGDPLANFRIPAELDPAQLPGVVWAGAETADVSIYEFYDYNCGYCRLAARELDAALRADPALRLGLVNDPILSVGSVQCAKIQQAVLRLAGPRVAYDFHLRLFTKPGRKDGPFALDLAREMSLDVAKIEESANAKSVGDVLSRQARLSSALGMETTPSFIIAGVGVLGWPGARSLRAMIADARRCDRPLCR
jgi:protein-disulfide isomerase